MVTFTDRKKHNSYPTHLDKQKNLCKHVFHEYIRFIFAHAIFSKFKFAISLKVKVITKFIGGIYFCYKKVEPMIFLSLSTSSGF